jgi:hypothetical protein
LIFLSAFIVAQFIHAELLLTPLSDPEADAIVAREIATKEKAEAAHIANSMAFNVLERREVNLGGRKLISNRVSDPQLPERKTKKRAKPISSAAIPPELLNRLSKEQHTLLLSATIHEGEPTVTHLSWRGVDGVEFEAWSSINWNFMRGVVNLSSETDSYLILQGVGPPSFEDEVPDLPPFTEGRAEYFVFADSAADIDGDAYEGIDLLHSYYEANEAALKVRYQRNEAINAAKKRYRAANPEKPKNAVVHFWKSGDDQ